MKYSKWGKTKLMEKFLQCNLVERENKILNPKDTTNEIFDQEQQQNTKYRHTTNSKQEPHFWNVKSNVLIEAEEKIGAPFFRFKSKKKKDTQNMDIAVRIQFCMLSNGIRLY